MALLLIRHGETDLNTARVVQFPDTPLGTQGLGQAEHLGLSLAERPIGQVLTSDYTRAQMTAERVAQHVGVEIEECIHLRERNFGDLRGTAYDDLGDVDIFGPDYHPPGGESWPEFHQRVDQAWSVITSKARETSGDLAVITHGLVLRSLFERKLDLGSIVLEDDLVVANTSVTEVEPEPPWRVVDLAGTQHLDEVNRQGGAV